MGSRVAPTRIMCVNCNICVNKMRRYPALALDSRITALICSWVYPQIILEDDYVSEACRDLAMAAVNDTLLKEVSGSEEARPSTRGHTNVCLLCGCSTLQRQSDLILRQNPTEMQQSIIDIIESKVALREILSSDRVCHACWLPTKREVLHMNRQDESRPQLCLSNCSSTTFHNISDKQNHRDRGTRATTTYPTLTCPTLTQAIPPLAAPPLFPINEELGQYHQDLSIIP